jgi:hypothetical protein
VTTRRLIACAAITLGATVGATSDAVPRPTPPAAIPERPGTAPTVSSTAAQQEDVGITVYNGGLALVRDVRTLTVPAGQVHVRFEDIAATVNPATVHLRSRSHPGRLPVLEQNYEYDLLDPDKLLRKYVGKSVTLVRTTTEGGATRTTDVPATLLALNNGPVWKIGDDIVTGIGADHYRFPELPDTLYSRPTLVWMLDNQGPQRQTVEAAYLAGNIGWSSDYVLTIDQDGTSGDLDGWVTLKNDTGTAFRNARLQLVAGDLHRAAPPPAPVLMEALTAQASRAREDMVEQAFSEYHLYTLGRRTSINNAETKQLSLLQGAGIPVSRRYSVYGQHWYYRNRQQPGTPLKDQVQVFYDFRNDAASRLGKPLPAGVVRVYQVDPNGQVQYVGEDRIDHTPTDERVSIEIGSAFDVVCERRQTDFEKLDGSTYELAYEIVLRNRKDTPITVELNEPIPGDWTMQSFSLKWTKTDASAMRFVAPVAAGAQMSVRYRVRVKW